MNWLINRKSQLSLKNKITIYKAIIEPVWTYRIELWGCSKHSKISPNVSIQNVKKIS
jgi:hypothetical protein